MKSASNHFYYKSNRLQQLRGFCYTAQFGNISKAAHYMGLTHSTVSLQIKALEVDLGVTLFERNGPHIRISPEGKLLYELAVPHIEGINNLHDVFHQELNTLADENLAIATNSTGLQFILPKIVKRHLETFSAIHVGIHFSEHHEALEKLLNDEVETVLLPRRDHLPFPDCYDYTPVFFYQSCLITRPDHPLAGRKNLSVAEISQYEISLPAEDLRVIPNLYEIFSKNKINKRLRVSFTNWETTRRYIEEGLVISISSDVIIGKNDVLVGTPLPHLFPDVDYGFLTKRDRKIPQKVAAFIETARQCA